MDSLGIRKLVGHSLPVTLSTMGALFFTSAAVTVLAHDPHTGVTMTLLLLGGMFASASGCLISKELRWSWLLWVVPALLLLALILMHLPH